MKKLFKELNKEEQLKVFNKNERLSYEVLQDYEESQMHHVTEILDGLKSNLSDYSIGFNNYNFIKVSEGNELNFLHDVLDVQSDFCLLSDDYNIKIKTVIEKIHIMNDMHYENIQYSNLEAWISTQVNAIISAILRNLNQLTEYPSNEELESYYTEFYIDSRMDDTEYYIDENFVLYEDVSYTKSYLHTA